MMSINESMKRNLLIAFLLTVILLVTFSIRIINNVPDRILSYDPVFEYRFTKYVADYGQMPVWDELSYYTGRMVNLDYSMIMHYLTAMVYWAIGGMGISLMTLASYMGAVYGAMMIIPAFLLGRKLSNNYGGLIAATLMGTAPQILIRTFGSSYDTDQLVLFFILLTTYLGMKAIKDRGISSISFAIIGFVSFMLLWGSFFIFTFFILVGFVIVNFLILAFFDKERKRPSLSILKNIAGSASDLKKQVLALVVVFLGITAFGIMLGKNTLIAVADIVGFARTPETWIVNISIAELQPFNIFSFNGWVTAMGRFVTGAAAIDIALFVAFILSIIFGLYSSYKSDIGKMSFILTLFIIGVYTTSRGIRFTEFSSAFNVILIAVGLGCLIEFLSKKGVLLKTFSIGLAISIAFIAINMGQQLGQSLGPDINSNWENAWTFLRTRTPELSLVGTWWDPGHMITGLAERRVIADGAHCTHGCKYNINDRIVDLGLIMATNDENVSTGLIRKYQGTSPAVYWIASDDLIGKYQWLQYFGTGCDARSDAKCPLYMQIPESNRYFDNQGNIVFNVYALGEQTNIMIYNGELPVPIYVQGINAALFDEVIFYNGTVPIPIKFTEEERNGIVAGLQPLERQLNIRFTNQTIPMAIWIPNGRSYIVAIPPNLRNNVFTRMFMLEGQGLEHFQQVFRNEQVKIYKVI